MQAISGKKRPNVPESGNVSWFSGRAEGAKKPEHDGQQRAVSVEAVDADPAVKGYSFFFDPNEPTGTSVAKGIFFESSFINGIDLMWLGVCVHINASILIWVVVVVCTK